MTARRLQAMATAGGRDQEDLLGRLAREIAGEGADDDAAHGGLKWLE